MRCGVAKYDSTNIWYRGTVAARRWSCPHKKHGAAFVRRWIGKKNLCHSEEKKRERSRKTARDCKYREALQSRRRRELWFTRNLISDSAWWPPDVGYALTKIQVCEKADAFVIQMSTAGTKMEKLGTEVSHTVKEEYLSPLPGRVPHSRGSKSRDMRNNRLGWHR